MSRIRLVGEGAGGGLLDQMEGHLCVMVDGVVAVVAGGGGRRGGGGMDLLVADGGGGIVMLVGRGE